jgi:hypothetical protein
MQMNMTQLCFSDLTTVEYRGDHGYKNSWFDVDDDPIDSPWQNFTFEIPKIDGDLYISVESYYQHMVAPGCYDKGHMIYPSASYNIYQNGIKMSIYEKVYGQLAQYTIFYQN